MPLLFCCLQTCLRVTSLLLCFTVKDPFTISTNQHPNSTASDMLTLSCDMLEFVFFFSLMDTTQSSCLILDYKFPTAPIHGSIHEGRLLGTTRRQRERRLKSVFALFQSLSQLLPPTYFVKCSRTLQELNSKGPFYGGGGQVGAPITQTSVKFATLCSNIFALFPAMSINIRLLCFIERWKNRGRVCSVLLSQLLFCRRKTDLCGAFRFMCFVFHV